MQCIMYFILWHNIKTPMSYIRGEKLRGGSRVKMLNYLRFYICPGVSTWFSPSLRCVGKTLRQFIFLSIGGSIALEQIITDLQSFFQMARSVFIFISSLNSRPQSAQYIQQWSKQGTKIVFEENGRRLTSITPSFIALPLEEMYRFLSPRKVSFPSSKPRVMIQAEKQMLCCFSETLQLRLHPIH